MFSIVCMSSLVFTGLGMKGKVPCTVLKHHFDLCHSGKIIQMKSIEAMTKFNIKVIRR